MPGGLQEELFVPRYGAIRSPEMTHAVTDSCIRCKRAEVIR
jgi:hypothetical protein